MCLGNNYYNNVLWIGDYPVVTTTQLSFPSLIAAGFSLILVEEYAIDRELPNSPTLPLPGAYTEPDTLTPQHSLLSHFPPRAPLKIDLSTHAHRGSR